jgi:hypothetical protein
VASTGSRSTPLEDAPLGGGEGDLERLGDLGVGEPHDVAQQQRHLEVGVQGRDGAEDGVHLLEPDLRVVGREGVRHGIDVERRLAPPLAGPQLVEHPVLGHLEQPGGEAAPHVEPGKALIDAQEDLLAQVLGQGPVAADDAQDVVEDRPLVLPHDRRECRLVAPLRSRQQGHVRLGDRH